MEVSDRLNMTLLLFVSAFLGAAQETPSERVPWDGSKIVGTPEPPRPYRTVPAFPGLSFERPVELVFSPVLDRFAILELSGKIYLFRNDPSESEKELCADLARDLDPFHRAYGFAFHPDFEKNRAVYVCYVTVDKVPDGTRVSRFTLPPGAPPKLDLASERVLLTWTSGGHNGGSLQFGPDGKLFISAGDGGPAFPPDPINAGQDLGNLLSTVMRIDVDRAAEGKAYSIPKDNPFVATPGARGEVWAYGFRNPWKMSFDPGTGDLWVGDVGWEMYELIYRVERGGNYGWSVTEGSQPVKAGAKRGPTPILGPIVEHAHTEARSVTGGFVYRGSRLPDLAGDYIYGDYITGKIWGLRYENRRIVRLRELAESPLAIICFALDGAGELLVVDYGGAIYRLEETPAVDAARKFPTRLSETGLFASVNDHAFAPGVLPYRINAAPWEDHATAERFVALPGTAKLGVYRKRDGYKGYLRGAWSFPDGAVLGKTILLETERGRPESRRRLETQILHRHLDQWRAYTYVWNDAQTDARLAGASGAERTFEIRDPGAPGGRRKQSWRFAGRAECMTCHNNRTGNLYGFTPEQLNREGQLAAFDRLGVFEEPLPKTLPRLADPADAAAALDARARAYLSINCSHCHRRGAGGSAFFETHYAQSRERTKLIDTRPTQGDFGIRDARIVASGDPFRSVLYYRMAKLGRGRMPHLGSEIVDRAGLRLIHDWIRSLSKTEVPGARLDAGALEAPESALRLLRAIDDGEIVGARKAMILAKAIDHPNLQVRDLFLRFLPDDRRKKVLGPTINPSEILALRGDAGRGKELFFRSTTGCLNCHRLESQGKEFGPDLKGIGGKYTLPQLLEQILEPSRSIHPDYLTYQVATRGGDVLAGFLVGRTDEEILLKEGPEKVRRVKAADVERMSPRPLSAMPVQLLRTLTAQEAADLVAYLKSLR